jgi:hypothetical protein
MESNSLNRKEALAAWAVKYVLMNQLTQGRDRQFAIPQPEYTRFYAERSPGSAMRLWAAHMEPPDKHSGPALAFADFSLHETYHDPSMLERAGISAELASKEFSAVYRFGHCVISLYRANTQILEAIRLINPGSWVQIWPAVGISAWSPTEPLLPQPTGRVDPLFAGLPVRVRTL